MFWTSSPGSMDCTVTEYTMEGHQERVAQAPCGVLRATPAGLLIVSADGASTLIPVVASFEPERSALIDHRGKDRLERIGGRLVWRSSGNAINLPAGLRSPRLLKDGNGVVAIQSGGEGERIVKIGGEGAVVELVAEPGLRIDSFDIEPAEREIVFSGGTSAAFDVGLASLEGDNFKWLPRELGHEHSVSWAPRGNKVTWFIEATGGAVMRTLHIPSGYQLSVPFQGSRVLAHTWDGAAEHVWALVESAAHSPATVAVRYGGEDRRFVVEPAERLDREPDFLAGIASPSVVYPPAQITYGRKYPATIVVTPEGVSSWSALVAELAREQDRGVIRISSPDLLQDSRFHRELRALAWLDPSGVVLLNSSGSGSRSSRSVVLLD